MYRRTYRLYGGLIVSTLLLLATGSALAWGASQDSASDGSKPSNESSSSSSTDQKGRGQTTGLTDQSFFAKSAEDALAELKLAELALTDAKTLPARAFAMRMLQDHAAQYLKMSEMASAGGITVPKRVQGSNEAARLRLREKVGSSSYGFDRAYLEQAIDDHMRSVTEFQTEISEGQDPAIMAFAQLLLPILQQHLSLAQQMLMAVENCNSATTGTTATPGATLTPGTTGMSEDSTVISRRRGETALATCGVTDLAPFTAGLANIGSLFAGAPLVPGTPTAVGSPGATGTPAATPSPSVPGGTITSPTPVVTPAMTATTTPAGSPVAGQTPAGTGAATTPSVTGTPVTGTTGTTGIYGPIGGTGPTTGMTGTL